MPELDSAERAFLRLISDFTPEDIKDAILNDIDLGRIVQEEYGAYLDDLRHMVSVYDAMHPNRLRSVSDYEQAAKRVLEWLKVQRPDLGYEIEAFATYPTTATIGLTTESKTTTQEEAQSDVHVGLYWLARQLQSLAVVLL